MVRFKGENPDPTDIVLIGAVGGTSKFAGKTVNEILKLKKGSILNAQLPPGSPSWDSIRQLTWETVEAAAKAGKTGFKTIKKLLSDTRFDK